MAGNPDFAKLRAAIDELDAAANDRVTDAESLFVAGRYAAAIAMGLYALEIRLKERICRRLELDALPVAFEIHDLGGLLTLAGLSKRMEDPSNASVLLNWNSIETWSKLLNELRYKPASDPRWQAPEAAQFFAQLRDAPNGVLLWLSRAAVRQAVRRVTQALHDFTREKGWKYAKHADWSQGDYYMDVVANMDWLRIYLTFVAKAYEGQDGLKRFLEVHNYLREVLKDDPQLRQLIVLVVKSPSEHDRDGLFPPGLSDERFDEDWVEQYIRHQRVS